jgi:hypothetical protein
MNEWMSERINMFHSCPGNESLLMQIKLFGMNTLTLFNLCAHIMLAFLCEGEIE